MDLATSMLEALSGTAKFKRLEQLKRWDDSETNRESALLPDRPRKINFSDGCVFLAACSASDKEEVKRLVSNGADIDTANVDGLTALHQACIDDNLEMVEFLIENGADVNKGDNEGWTPLHATASCGFISIAKYLIEHGALVAAVNNDGELPIDIAESDEMEELLQEEIDNQGIDCDAARNEEENLMVEDANRWLNSGIFKDRVHPKTGATALHVAAAKGYVKVLSLLIQAGANVNAQDVDGWTPLHAAAHWGQKEACEILVENMCDMDMKNFVGQYAVDVADLDMAKLLEELRKKQATMQNENNQSLAILDHKLPVTGKRRSSITRMSGSDKTHFNSKDKTQERVQIDTTPLPITKEAKKPIIKKVVEIANESSESSESSESEDSEIEKKNKANKNKTSLDIHRLEGNQEDTNDRIQSREQSKPMPKPSEAEEDIPVWRRGVRKNDTSPVENSNQSSEIIPRSVLGSRSSFLSNSSNNNEQDQEPERIDRRRPVSLESDERFTKFGSFVWQARSNRPNSLPASMTTTTTTTAAAITTAVTTSTTTTTVTRLSTVHSSPVMLRKHDENATKVQDAISVASTSSMVTTTMTTTTATSTPNTPVTPTGSNLRRSYVPPLRDDESETQRKAHAKRVRETRRSTQGVTLEEVKSAEQLIKQQETGKPNEGKDTKVDGVTDRIQDLPPSQERGNELERRPSWRLRLEQDQNKSSEENRPSWRSRDVPTDTSSTSEVPTSTGYVRRSRISFSDGESALSSSTARTRNSKTDDDDVKDQDKENDNNSSSVQATQAAIHRRRRPKRRSTGVVYPDMDDSDGSQENKDQDGEKQDDTDSQNSSERNFRSRYGSSGSITDAPNRTEGSLRLSERISRNQNEGDKDYKVLYEEAKVENERLRDKLKKCETDREDFKVRCEKLQQVSRNSSSDAEKRERRALERKVSEMEEELKLLNKIKQENEKLKAENRALTRVVSKLSNK